MLATLTQAFGLLGNQKKAIAAFNVFGFEDAVAIIAAAEDLGESVVLMANKPALAHMPVEILAAILCEVGKRATVPVVVHLDHATDEATIQRAILSGFTSVMFDGSQFPFDENVARSLEAAFEQKVAPDALAIAVGTVHRMTTGTAQIDFDLMDHVVARLRTPVVIHGSSGVPDADLRRLVQHGAKKINIGTALRMAFGRALREGMARRPEEFDRIKLFGPCMKAVTGLAREKILLLNGD